MRIIQVPLEEESFSSQTSELRPKGVGSCLDDSKNHAELLDRFSIRRGRFREDGFRSLGNT